MIIKNLRSRMINRSRDSLASYSFISKSTTSIIDLDEVQRYFMFENLLAELLVEGKIELKINQIILDKSKDDSDIKKEYEKSKDFEKHSFKEWLRFKQINISSKLEKLNKKQHELERETGINCLRIGLFYVTLKFSTDVGDEIFRAPLFFIKVKIEINQKTILSIDKNDNFLELNDILFERVAFIKNKKLDYKINQKIIELFDSNQNPLSILEKAVLMIKEKIFKTLDLEIDDRDFSFKNFTKFCKASLRKREINKDIKDYNLALFSNYATIGIFKTTSFEIIYDLEKLEQQNGDDFLLEMEHFFSDEFNFLEKGNEDFNESEINQITDLDFSQKVAILKALKENTVIKGPPGTGKSQTISNLIINIINNGKNLIFSAEKKVATEVVYNNLDIFKRFAIKIHDLSKDKKSFYKQLSDNWKFISSTYDQSSDFNGFIEECNTNINNAFEQMKNYTSFLKSPEYITYLTCLQENRELDVSFDRFVSKVNDFKVFLKFDILKEKDFNALINDLKEKKNLVDFYYQIFDQEFIFDNFNYLNNIFNFDWNNSSKKNQRILVYFYKNNILKKNPNIFSLLFSKKIKEEFHAKYDFSKTFKYLKSLTDEEKKLWKKLKTNHFQLDQLEILYKNLRSDEDIIKLVQKLYIQKFENNYQNILNSANDIDWNQIIKDNLVNKIKNSKWELRDNICNKIIQKVNDFCMASTFNQRKWTKFIKIISENKKFPSIKSFIENFRDIIFIMTPILITSVDIVPSVIPLVKGIFDYTIFDEASQIYLEKTIAILYRGKINIVVGDDRQLAPTNYFLKSIVVDNDDDEDNFFAESAEEFSSLLDYVGFKFQRVHLKYHYRSLYRELIEFSNQHFYDSTLIFVDSNEINNSMQPIEEIFVEGIWNNQVNEIEADKVLSLLDKIVNTKKIDESIGIITFNKKQSELINEKLNTSNNLAILSEINNRSEKDYLFVKNLEEVQGDERDIIILAISFASNLDGKFFRNFGPINRVSGENRINVAITRAKNKIYVVKSIKAKDVFNPDEKEPISNGALILGKYLDYVEKLQSYNLNDEEIKSLFLDAENQELPKEHQRESVFTKEVYKKLKTAFLETNYSIKQKINQNGYYIDLAVWDAISCKFLLAIQCDNNIFNTNLAVKERDWYLQNFLEEKGWKFYKINPHNWWKNDSQNKIIEEIKTLVERHSA